MNNELFPPRKIRQVRPEDSVNEVLDAMAGVGWNLRQAMVDSKAGNGETAIGTFREFWRECPGCQKRTRWSFTQMEGYIAADCEECDHQETFGTWDEVIEVVDER